MCGIVLCVKRYFALRSKFCIRKEERTIAVDVQLKRGILEICILSVLARGDSYGYQIMKDLSDVLPITESTLYPILKRLENAGCLLVSSVEHNGRLRKVYQLTSVGKEKIGAFLEDWKDVMHAYQLIESCTQQREERKESNDKRDV